MGLADVLEPGREPEDFAFADTVQIELLDDDTPPSSSPIVVSARYGRARCVVPMAFPPPREARPRTTPSFTRSLVRRFEALARRCGDRMTAARLAMVCMSALVLAAAGSAFALARPQAPDVPAPIAESAPVDARIDARVEPRVEVDANMGANTGANDSAGARVHRKPTAAPRAASAARAGRR